MNEDDIVFHNCIEWIPSDNYQKWSWDIKASKRQSLGLTISIVFDTYNNKFI